MIYENAAFRSRKTMERDLALYSLFINRSEQYVFRCWFGKTSRNVELPFLRVIEMNETFDTYRFGGDIIVWILKINAYWTFRRHATVEQTGHYVTYRNIFRAMVSL